MTSSIRSQPWSFDHSPKRILAVRLHALGDSVIPLPYLQSLRQSLPRTGLDYLTLQENSEIPNSVELFDRVHELGGGRSYRKQMLHAASMLPRLLRQKYDVVLDLQNNEISRMVRRVLRPAAWSEFDRFSPIAAGERTSQTIAALCLPATSETAIDGTPDLTPGLTVRNNAPGLKQLKSAGWDGEARLVVLNPAGFHATRNWPLENYVAFANLWHQHEMKHRHGSGLVQFLVLGLESLSPKSKALKDHIGPSLLDLTGKTTASEAFSILQRVSFVLSEDSGLMHMAWVSGIPTLALFGSSRADWSRPLGEHSHCLHSGDLPCGSCMEPTCRHGDVRCLTRYSAELVFETAQRLLDSKHSPQRPGT